MIINYSISVVQHSPLDHIFLPYRRFERCRHKLTRTMFQMSFLAVAIWKFSVFFQKIRFSRKITFHPQHCANLPIVPILSLEPSSRMQFVFFRFEHQYGMRHMGGVWNIIEKQFLNNRSLKIILVKGTERPGNYPI